MGRWRNLGAGHDVSRNVRFRELEHSNSGSLVALEEGTKIPRFRRMEGLNCDEKAQSATHPLPD
jgi:hypothetical protein